MKTRNIKLVTFGFAAMLLASCSDSNDTPNPTPNPAETGIIGKEVTSDFTPSPPVGSLVLSLHDANTNAAKPIAASVELNTFISI